MVVTNTGVNRPTATVSQAGWYTRAEGEVARNNVLSRGFIEGLGVMPWRMAFARNKFERIEAFLDTFVWWVIGFALPILIQGPLSRRFTATLQQRYPMRNKAPLTLGLDQLERGAMQSGHTQNSVMKTLGIQYKKHLIPITKALTAMKLGMIFLDLACMSGKNQLYWWGRNKLTEYLSKKKGFSGEFNIASEQQREQNAKAIASSEKKRHRISSIIGVLYPVVLPLALWGLMRAKQPVGKGILGKLKKVLPAFNYHNSIYLTKWVVFWNCLMGWNLGGLLAARDTHERREHLVRCAILDFFFFVGDDVFAGIAGKMLQKRHAKSLKGVHLYKPSWFGVPLGRSLDAVAADAQRYKSPQLMALAERLSRINFRIGILSTTVFLGIGTTLANNWFTKKKLLAEQQQVAKMPVAPPVTIPSSPLARFVSVRNAHPFVLGEQDQASTLQWVAQ